ncbi:MAG: M23 family metallopeptidase [Cyanobacteria bacterium P01_H01_bin.21]
MHVFQRFYKYLLLSGLGLCCLGANTPAQAASCPEGALAQVVEHRTHSGETLSAVAEQYGLLPSTLATMNPTLPSEEVLPTGQIVEVPPFNGLVVPGGAGQTWQSLAEQHGTRADLLFELNGCPDTLPSQVFIPSVSRGAAVSAASIAYPLPAPASLILSYGWQPHSQRDELVFNSGIAFAAASGTQVTAADSGTVAFVGEQNGALKVVVNHRDGLQTRYGNLENVALAVGDLVSQGDSLGTVAGGSAESFMYFEVRTNSREGWVARDPALYLRELELQR